MIEVSLMRSSRVVLDQRGDPPYSSGLLSQQPACIGATAFPRLHSAALSIDRYPVMRLTLAADVPICLGSRWMSTTSPPVISHVPSNDTPSSIEKIGAFMDPLRTAGAINLTRSLATTSPVILPLLTT